MCRHLLHDRNADILCSGSSKIVRAADGNIPIVFGGTHPTILPEQTIKNEYVDIVCVGEGDITFPELVRALQSHGSLAKVDGIVFKNGSNITMTQSRPLLDVETLLPTPWELIEVESYIHRDLYLKESCRNLDIGQTSRGVLSTVDSAAVRASDRENGAQCLLRKVCTTS